MMKSFSQFLMEATDYSDRIKYAQGMIQKFRKTLEDAKRDNKPQTFIDSCLENIKKWEEVIEKTKKDQTLQHASNEEKIAEYQKQLEKLKDEIEVARFKDKYSGKPSRGGTHEQDVRQRIRNVEDAIKNLQSKS